MGFVIKATVYVTEQISSLVQCHSQEADFLILFEDIGVI